MNWTILRRSCAAIVLTMAACDGDVSQREGDGVSPDPLDNGVLLNSFRLNSFRLNSFRLNSFRLNGDPGTQDYIQMVAVDLPGKDQPAHSWIDGSELRVVTTHAKVLAGTKLVGTRISFAVQEDGVEHLRELWIAGVALPKTSKHKHKHKHKQQDAADAGLVTYDLRIRELPNTKWAPLCGLDGEGKPIATVLLSDVWDPETGAQIVPRPSGVVTLACVDAALGKCASWGYHPWASQGGEPLADYHQACTRLVRADYCGDGTPHTLDGTPIHVLDPLGIEKVDPYASYVVEAEWGPDGAVCLNPANTRLPDVEVACADLLPPCGDDFAAGGLLQSGKLVGGGG